MKRLTRSYLLRYLRRKGVVLAREAQEYSTEELERIWLQLNPGTRWKQAQFFREREREDGVRGL